MSDDSFTEKLTWKIITYTFIIVTALSIIMFLFGVLDVLAWLKGFWEGLSSGILSGLIGVAAVFIARILYEFYKHRKASRKIKKGFELLQRGKDQEALKFFEETARNEKEDAVIRAKAGYECGLICAAENYDKAYAWYEYVFELDEDMAEELLEKIQEIKPGFDQS